MEKRKKPHQKTSDPNLHIKKVENFLIDMNWALGEGQYGKVYFAQEINDEIWKKTTNHSVGSSSKKAEEN